MKNTIIQTAIIFCLFGITSCTTLGATSTVIPNPTITPSATLIPSPTANATLSIIVPENASNIKQLNQLGKGFLNQVLWSPDGKKLITASRIGLHFYDAETYQEVGFIDTDKQITYSAINFDGTIFATGGDNSPTQLWDTNSGHLLKTFEKGAQSLAFSPDGQILAVGMLSGVRIWDTKTGQVSSNLTGHSGFVSSLSFSPDGKILAAAFSGGDAAHDENINLVQLWEVASGKPLGTLYGHGRWVPVVAFSPDGQSLASISEDGQVHLWDTATALNQDTQRVKPRDSFPGFTLGMWALAFSPNSKSLAYGLNESIRFSNTSTGKTEQTLKGHTGDVIGLAFRPDGKVLASASEDQTIRLWDANTGQVLHIIDGYMSPANAVTFSPDGQLLATGGSGYTHNNDINGDTSTRLWQLSTGQVVKKFDDKHSINSIAFSPTANTIAIASRDARILDMTTGEPLFEFHIIEQRPASNLPSPWLALSVAFSPDGQTVALGTWDSTELWDVKTGEQIRIYEKEMDRVRQVAFSPDGQQLISIGLDVKIHQWPIRIWDVKTGKQIRIIDHQKSVDYIAFSPQQNLLAVGSTLSYSTGESIIELWDLNTGTIIRTFEGSNNMAFSPDGRLLATLGLTHLQIWDAISGKLLQTFDIENAMRIAFRPDGKMIAVSSFNGTIQLWGVPEQ